MSFLVFIKDATNKMGVLSSNPANEPAVLVSASTICSSAISSSTILDTNFSPFTSSVKLSCFHYKFILMTTTTLMYGSS